MKIWLDRAPMLQSLPNDCANDCDDCTQVCTGLAHIELPVGEEAILPIRVGTLQQTVPLHIQVDALEHWIVCNPTGQGYIVVLDAESYALLEQFRTPRLLADVLMSWTEVAPTSIEGMVALFYKLGFLEKGASQVKTEEAEQYLSAWLHITNSCNLRCQYCYLEKTNEDMADDTAYRAVDAIFRSATKHHFEQVTLKYAGGEVSFHLGRVLAIHDYATSLAQKCNITLRAAILSNGVFLSQQAIAMLKACNIDVMISLDGIGSAHDRQRPFISGRGSFNSVDRTIKRLQANALVPHISVTVSQLNLAGLPDLLTYILHQNLPFTLNYYRDNECATDRDTLQFAEQQMIDAMHSAFAVIESNLPRRCLLDSLLDKASLLQPHQHTCAMGRQYLVIDQRGGIAKCQADIKHTVTTIDADDPLQAIRSDKNGVRALSVDEKEGCRSCEWRYWCSGGCPLLTYKMTGRQDIKSPNCNIYKALFPAVLRLEALRLLKYEMPVCL